MVFIGTRMHNEHQCIVVFNFLHCSFSCQWELDDVECIHTERWTKMDSPHCDQTKWLKYVKISVHHTSHQPSCNYESLKPQTQNSNISQHNPVHINTTHFPKAHFSPVYYFVNQCCKFYTLFICYGILDIKCIKIILSDLNTERKRVKITEFSTSFGRDRPWKCTFLILLVCQEALTKNLSKLFSKHKMWNKWGLIQVFLLHIILLGIF